MSVLLWTRHVSGDGGPVELRAEMFATAEFGRVAGGGVVQTGPWRDHTAKLTVDGLTPGNHVQAA